MPKDPANRPRTGFSFYRFMIPQLCGYRGRALYLDADMQVFTDLAELWDIEFGQHKVLCTNQPSAPKAWKKWGSFFHPGRQMSVMLLDCSRLDWDIAKIVQGLDQGAYSYQDLMFHLCVVPDEEIADRIPPEWNCLEWYERDRTKLLHYTVVPTQPWKTDDNPLADIWTSAFAEAVQSGAVAGELVEKGIEAGHLKPGLASWLCLAGGMGSSSPAHNVELLRRELGDLPPGELFEQLAEARRQMALARQQVLVLQEQSLHLRAENLALRDFWPLKVSRAVARPLRKINDRFFRKAS